MEFSQFSLDILLKRNVRRMSYIVAHLNTNLLRQQTTLPIWNVITPAIEIYFLFIFCVPTLAHQTCEN